MSPRLLLLVAVVVAVLVAAPLSAASPDAAVRDFVTLAWAGEFDALPKAAHAKTEAFERFVRNVLRVRCVSVDSIRIDDLAPTESGATATLEVAIRKVDRTDPRWVAADVIPLRVALVRDGGRWLVSAVAFPDEDFADQLVAASGEERRRLLRESPHRVSRNLARAVYRRALAVFNYSKGTAAEVSRDATGAAALANEIALAAGDRGAEALALGIHSIDAWMQHDDVARATRLARESLAIAEVTGEPEVLARAWYNLGRALGRAPEAQRPGRVRSEWHETYRKGLAFAERSEDPYILLRTLSVVAAIANGQCDHLGTRLLADRMLVVARETGDVAGEIDGESLLATVYRSQGDPELALFHHQRALKLAEEHHSRLHTALLIRSAEFLEAEGRLNEARAALAKVVRRDERGRIIANSVSPGFQAMAIELLADIEASDGKLDEAECLRRELDAEHPGDSLHLLAPAASARGNFALALRLTLASLAEASNHLPYQQARSLSAAARAYRGLGEHGLALESIEEAIELAERLGGMAGDVEQHVLDSDWMADLYELATVIALDRGEPAEALTFLERGRARVLIDILEHGRPGALEEADAALREEQQRRERALVQLNLDLDRARAANDRRAIDTLTARLSTARLELASFLDGLATRSARRHAARQEVSDRGLAERIERLPAGMVAVEYLVDDEQLHLFVVRADASGARRVAHHARRIERKTLDERVEALVASLSGRDLHAGRAARDVYDLLIPPIESEIADAESLLVIPDDQLWRVPFAALLDARGRYLLERAPIVYAPSISAWTAISESRPARQAAAAVSLLAVANPTLTVTSKNALTSFYRDATFGPLPDAEHEVDAVGALYDPHAVVLKGQEATETRIKSAVGGATVVHFATHGVLDDTHPMYSRLALANDGTATDDGWLESWEIARLNLTADVVVLSACETARGRVGGGEGVVGMAWSFFLAGARSTVATQWKIASQRTAELMIAFHRSLHAGGHDPALLKAHALRDAQLQLLRDPASAHPYYWGAFVLHGDPSWGPPADSTAGGVAGTRILTAPRTGFP